jgi:hypothetical protein
MLWDDLGKGHQDARLKPRQAVERQSRTEMSVRLYPESGLHDCVGAEHDVGDPGEPEGDDVGRNDDDACESSKLPNAPKSFQVSTRKGHSDEREEELQDKSACGFHDKSCR